jgi:hypothetical protein
MRAEGPVHPAITDSAPKSGNIRYTVVRQAFKWQQNWQQRGNRLATLWLAHFLNSPLAVGFTCFFLCFDLV